MAALIWYKTQVNCQCLLEGASQSNSSIALLFPCYYITLSILSYLTEGSKIKQQVFNWFVEANLALIDNVEPLDTLS